MEARADFCTPTNSSYPSRERAPTCARWQRLQSICEPELRWTESRMSGQSGFEEVLRELAQQQSALSQQQTALLQLQTESLRLQRLLIERALGGPAPK
jgi:hypothetical protein